jgi:hypothetical protein
MDKNKVNKWDKEKQAEYHKEWRERNKEHLAEYNKKWREENEEYIKKYLEDNKEKIAERAKEWRESHVEERKKLWDEWYKKNKLKSLGRRFSSAKSKSKKRGIEWKLTLEEYIEIAKEPCYYCENNLGRPVVSSVGLDRLDSNGCYELLNVVSCCYACNLIKNTELTPEETKIAVKAVLDFRDLRKNASDEKK